MLQTVKMAWDARQAELLGVKVLHNTEFYQINN
jgi:hypothetical protein